MDVRWQRMGTPPRFPNGCTVQGCNATSRSKRTDLRCMVQLLNKNLLEKSASKAEAAKKEQTEIKRHRKNENHRAGHHGMGKMRPHGANWP